MVIREKEDVNGTWNVVSRSTSYTDYTTNICNVSSSVVRKPLNFLLNIAQAINMSNIIVFYVISDSQASEQFTQVF